MPDLERLRRIAEVEGGASFPQHVHARDQQMVGKVREQALRQLLTCAGSKITTGG